MAFRVFLSHSLDPAEQALAWRLQTLAAAHGIEVFVPQRGSALSSSALVALHNAIDRSDCVLAIIISKADASVRKELQYALAQGKPVIPIVHSDFANHPWLAQFPRFIFSPSDNPGKVEGQVVEYLKQQHFSKENRQAVGALVALGIGLLLLSALSEK